MATSKIDNALQQLLKLGFEVKKLWTNASPTSAFAAQTVTLSGGSKYDAVLIEYLPSTADYSDTNGTLIPLIVPLKHKNYLNYIANTEKKETIAELRSRAVTFTGGTAVFATAYGFSISSTSRSERTDYAIPVSIFGLNFIGGGYNLTRFFKHLFSCVGRRCI